MKKILKIFLFSVLSLFALLILLVAIVPTDNVNKQKDESENQAVQEESQQAAELPIEPSIVLTTEAQDQVPQEQKEEPATTTLPVETKSVEPQQKSASLPTTPAPTPEQPKQPENAVVLYSVIRVIDGDTIEVDYQGVKTGIRLIGINTPETVDPRKQVECFGKEASNKMKTLVNGEKVRLDSDPTQSDKDKYSRLLRYVFLENGTHVNLLMIRDGYAYEYTYQAPYHYQTEFKQAETEARTAKRGLWADNACPQEESAPAPTPQPQSQPQPVTPAPTVSCTCSGDLYNCKDFKTHKEAQAVFDCCMAHVSTDIHKLDANNDWKACESLP